MRSHGCQVCQDNSHSLRKSHSHSHSNCHRHLCSCSHNNSSHSLQPFSSHRQCRHNLGNNNLHSNNLEDKLEYPQSRWYMQLPRRQLDNCNYCATTTASTTCS